MPLRDAEFADRLSPAGDDRYENVDDRLIFAALSRRVPDLARSLGLGQ